MYPTKPTGGTRFSQYLIGQEGWVTVPNLSSSLAQELYAIGVHTLALSVTGDGQDKGPYTTTADLVVVAESIDASWWIWTGPTGGIPWNTAYGLQGALVNKFAWSAVKAQCALIETNVTDGTPSVPRGTQAVSANIGPNANPVVFTPTITQNWQWVSAPAGLIVSDVNRLFSYTVIMSVQDSWGNTYPPVSSNPLGVYVSVPQNKIGDAKSARLAAAAAVSCLGFGPLSIIVGAGCAAIAAIVEQSNLNAAQDPPAPDFNCTVATELVTPRLPSLPAGATCPYCDLLELVLRCRTTMEALTRTEEKLLGARIRKDVDSIDLQIKTYEEIENQLLATANQLPQALAAVEAVADNGSVPLEKARATIRLWQTYGVPAEVEEVWLEDKLSTTTIATLRTSIASVDVENLPSLSSCLAGLVNATLGQIQYVDQNMVAVLLHR